jgi:hypothetical protein
MGNKVEKAEVEEREIPVLKPGNVSIQSAGQIYKTAVVQLPEDMTFQDLNDHPEIWKLVQENVNTALSEYDKVELRAVEWTAWASVNNADRGQVILYDIRKASKPKREVALFSDSKFEVRWSHEGYAYYRKADNVKMCTATFPTPEAAKQALIREQYPPTVSSI